MAGRFSIMGNGMWHLRKWNSEEHSIDEALTGVSEELIKGKNEPGNLYPLKLWWGDVLLWEMACFYEKLYSSIFTQWLIVKCPPLGNTPPSDSQYTPQTLQLTFFH